MGKRRAREVQDVVRDAQSVEDEPEDVRAAAVVELHGARPGRGEGGGRPPGGDERSRKEKGSKKEGLSSHHAQHHARERHNRSLRRIGERKRPGHKSVEETADVLASRGGSFVRIWAMTVGALVLLMVPLASASPVSGVSWSSADPLALRGDVSVDARNGIGQLDDPHAQGSLGLDLANGTITISSWRNARLDAPSELGGFAPPIAAAQDR